LSAGTESALGMQNTDPGGKKLPTKKKEKSEEIFCFEVLNVLFGGLKASPVAWTFFMKEFYNF
jgi:hypothetical protein